MPEAKEMRFFVYDEYYNQGEGFLVPFYQEVGDEKIIGGGNATLMYFPRAPERVLNYNPDIKLIAVLRNPIDRALSSYWYARKLGYEPRPFRATGRLPRHIHTGRSVRIRAPRPCAPSG